MLNPLLVNAECETEGTNVRTPELLQVPADDILLHGRHALVALLRAKKDLVR